MTQRIESRARVDVFMALPGEQHDRLLPGLARGLDTQERERAERFVFIHDRRCFLAAHALMRHALARCLPQPGFMLVQEPLHAPRLAPPLADWHLSLSHTTGLVAVAVGFGIEVGIDVEASTRTIDVAAVAGLALAAEEHSRVVASPDPARCLLRHWVVKEAVAKAVGLGLALEFDRVVLGGDPLAVHRLPPECGQPGEWHIEQRDFIGHHAALAIRHDRHQAPTIVWHDVRIEDLCGEHSGQVC